jgi:hypothetical protein
MTKGAIQAANQAKNEDIINLGQNQKMVIKSDRKRMQKEQKWKSRPSLANAGAVSICDCMDVDLSGI